MSAVIWWLAGFVALPTAASCAASVRRTLRRQRALTEQLLRVEAAKLAEAKARHLGSAGGGHRCCRLVGVRVGLLRRWRVGSVPAVQCGLDCCHGGPCVPFEPGVYLLPPLLHPLGLLRLRFTPWLLRRCPVCGRGFQAGDQESLTMMREDGDGWRRSDEIAWRFWPCGCEAREMTG